MNDVKKNIQDMDLHELYISMFASETKAEDDKSYTCWKCKNDIIVDVQHHGIQVCCSCGIVLDEIFDKNIEWKGDNNVGRSITPYNVLLPQSSLGTSIAGNYSSRVKKLHIWSQMPYKERSLNDVFKLIDKVCYKVGILKCIADDTKIKYKLLSESRHEIGANKGRTIITRGKNRLAFIAACLDNSCKKKGIAKPVRVIADTFGIEEKDMAKGRKMYKKMMRLQHQQFDMQKTPESYIGRYCAILKIDNKETDKIMAIAKNIEKLSIATDHAPQLVAIGCIIILGDNTKVERDKHSELFGVSSVTLNKVIAKINKYLRIIMDDKKTEHIVKELGKVEYELSDNIKARAEEYNIKVERKQEIKK